MKKKIAILTSSRSDFGIYLPLLLKLKDNNNIDLNIIAFGTHLSKSHGYTIDEIKSYGFKNILRIKSPTKNNSSFNLSNNISKTIELFSKFWNNNNFDLIIAFGDRYEMFAAVTAATPFILNIAHYSAGETTLGAIDNIFRHSISLMSKILFTTSNEYYIKAKNINTDAAVYNVGSLSIDNLCKINFLTIEEIKNRFQIDISKPTILATIHPETVALLKNKEYTLTFINTCKILCENYQIVITLPNADTLGDLMKKMIIENVKNYEKIFIYESLGMIGYLSFMKYCSFMIGNTSSGFVEASFFPKWVINLGNRQQGRILTKNIINVPFSKQKILNAVKKIEADTKQLEKQNIYGQGNTSELIIEKLNQFHGI